MTPPEASDPRRERGATVLEVVIALAITALLAASATQITGFGLSTLDRATAASARGGDALAARRTLADAFSRISAGDDVFAANEEAITWRGALPGAAGWRVGVWRLTLGDGEFARCEAVGDATCDPTDELAIAVSAAAFEDAAGTQTGVWPKGPAPALIVLETASGLVEIAPRVRGFQ